MPNPYPQDDPRWAPWEEENNRQTDARIAAASAQELGVTVNNPAMHVAPAAPQTHAAAYLNYDPVVDDPMGQTIHTAPETVSEDRTVRRKADGTEGKTNEFTSKPTLISGTPGRMLPGGWQPHSRSMTQEHGLQLDDLTRERIAQNERDKAAAVEQATWAERRRAEITGEWNQQQAQTKMLDAAKAEERQRYRDSVIADAKAKYDKAAQIDPEAWWNNKSGLGKILASIAVGVGAFVQGRTGQPNAVLDQINKEIDRDVKAQMAKLDKARQDIQDYYGQWDREDQRIAAGKAARLDIAMAHLDDLLASTNDAAKRAQGLELRAKLEDEAIKNRLVLLKEEQGKKVSQGSEVYEKPKYVGGTPARMNWNAMYTEASEKGLDGNEIARKAREMAKERGISLDAATAQIFYDAGINPQRYAGDPAKGGGKALNGSVAASSLYIPDAFGPGKGGYASTESEAIEIRKILGKKDQFIKAGERLIELRRQFGSTIWRSDASIEAKALLATRSRIGKELANTGASSTDAEMQNFVDPLSGQGAFDFFSTEHGAELRIKSGDAQVQLMVDSIVGAGNVTPGEQKVSGGVRTGAMTHSAAPSRTAKDVGFKPAGSK